MARELVFSATRKDFRIDYFSGTGAGGQYRNKTQNCVRITYLPDGTQTVGQRHRERSGNFRDAFTKMVKILVRKYVLTAKYRNTEENVIRTYHEPDNRVTDHVSGIELPYSTVLNKKGIDQMITGRKMAVQ